MYNDNIITLNKLYNEELELNKNRLILATLLFNNRYGDLTNRIKESSIEYLNNNLCTYNGCCKYSLEGNHLSEDQIIVNVFERHNYDIQGTLIHELRHHLVSHSEEFNGRYLIAKRGLSELTIDLFKYTSYKTGIGLEELYNSYITELMLNDIPKIKNTNINNESFKNYINNIGFNQYKSYREFVDFFMPLLTLEELTNFVDKETFKGNINKIESEFNICFSKIIKYEQLKKMADYLFTHYNDERMKNEMKKNLDEINKIYKKTMFS